MSLYKCGLKKDETIIERKKEIEKYRLNLIDLDSWKFIKKIDDNAHFYIIFYERHVNRNRAKLSLKYSLNILFTQSLWFN